LAAVVLAVPFDLSTAENVSLPKDRVELPILHGNSLIGYQMPVLPENASEVPKLKNFGVLGVVIGSVYDYDVEYIGKWKYATDYKSCQCLEFAKSKIGWKEPVETPLNFWNNAERYGYKRILEPEKDTYLITLEGNKNIGHISYVEEVNYNNVVVIEQNFVDCILTRRTIDRHYNLIVGYLKPVNKN